jgi:predicted trehalose synthase
VNANELVDYASKQRWFRSKARTRARAEIREAIELGELSLVLLRVEFTEGAPDTYAIPVDSDGRDAVADPRFAAALLAAIVPGEQLPARSLGVEQSNTSLVFGDRYICKLYRVIDDEPSVELEMARFLATHAPEYRGSPPLVGALEHGTRTLAVMFELVPNQGDAWKLALQGDPEAFVERARLLGTRTAELHAALARGSGDPAFAPEPFEREEPLAAVRESLARTLALAPALAPRAADIERALAAVGGGGMRTRTHGDYHLGQVLWTGSDFQIIDFEGEPSAPPAERRAKRSPLRDVAGMLRSIDYAGAAGKRPRAWTERVQQAFLAGYGAADAALVRLFAIEKALYEIRYELNNRPDWVDIPMRGLHALLEDV